MVAHLGLRLVHAISSNRWKASGGPAGWRGNLMMFGALLGLGFVHGAIPSASGDQPISGEPEFATAYVAPQQIEDLRQLQAQVQRVVAKAYSATVGLRIGNGYGSGVVVAPDGLILTAGHVVMKSGRSVRVMFSNGRSVMGTTLGVNDYWDAGMVKINTPGPWPHLSPAKATRAAVGSWCLALGYPGGYEPGQTPLLRLGRVLGGGRGRKLLQSDCQLVGGDSGGPLLDLDGNIIAIHSRIGENLANNQHVPISAFRNNWEMLERDLAHQPYLGVKGYGDTPGNGKNRAEVASVVPNSAADKADIREGDVVESVNGRQVKTFAELTAQVSRMLPGDDVTITIRREGQSKTIIVSLGSRADTMEDVGRSKR